MTRALLSLACLLSICALAAAQPVPDGDRPGPPPRHDGDGPGGRERPDGPRGGPGGAPPRPGPFEQMRNYLELVDRYSKIANDPSTAGVAAVISTADILRPQGPKAIIEHFQKLLPDVKDPAVERAIRLQLADMYRQTQEPALAIEQLSHLIKAPKASQ